MLHSSSIVYMDHTEPIFQDLLLICTKWLPKNHNNCFHFCHGGETHFLVPAQTLIYAISIPQVLDMFLLYAGYWLWWHQQFSVHILSPSKMAFCNKATKLSLNRPTLICLSPVTFLQRGWLFWKAVSTKQTLPQKIFIFHATYKKN